MQFSFTESAQRTGAPAKWLLYVSSRDRFARYTYTPPVHIFGRRWWLSAALLLLLGLSSPATWLASAAPRASSCPLPCCCPHEMALAAPCCQMTPAPLAVAVLAPARSAFPRAQKATAPAIVPLPPSPFFSETARIFPAQSALPPPGAVYRRIGSCRAPPSKSENI